MKGKFLIGELSKIFKISTDTLRYYDKINLLKPDDCGDNGYRHYGIRKFFKLSRILFLKNLDISLDEIKDYMEHKNTKNLMIMLKTKEEELDEKIAKLTNLKGKISGKLSILENIDADFDNIQIKELPELAGVFLSVNDVKDDEEIKKSIKNTEKYMHISSWLIEGQVYTSMTVEDMKNRNYERYRYFISIESIYDDYKKITVLPAGDYASVVFKGPYSKYDYYYDMMLKWIDDNGYEVSGRSLEKNIVDYDFSDSEEEYISELLIPIKEVSKK
jgi:DNA-binding transcriptional MerR regulator